MTPIGNEYVILKPNFNNALQLSRMTYVRMYKAWRFGLRTVQYNDEIVRGVINIHSYVLQSIKFEVMTNSHGFIQLQFPSMMSSIEQIQ